MLLGRPDFLGAERAAAAIARSARAGLPGKDTSQRAGNEARVDGALPADGQARGGGALPRATRPLHPTLTEETRVRRSVGVLPGFSKPLRHGVSFAGLALRPQCALETRQRPSGFLQELEILAECGLGFSGPAGVEQDVTEPVPDRVVPGRRLIVRERVLEPGGGSQARDGGIEAVLLRRRWWPRAPPPPA